MISFTNISNLKIVVILVLFTSFIVVGQTNDSIEKNKKTVDFSFSWTKPHTDKSLQPIYIALKDAEYGVERFSLFEQLINHHTQKANTDSILHYGNLYVKELGNWDKPENIKKHHYTKAYYYMSIGSFFNGLIDKSIEWNIKGLQEAELGKNEEYKYLHKIGLARNYIAQKKPDKAIELLKSSISSYSKEYSKITNKALVLLGNAYLHKKKYNKANEYYEESYSLAEKFNDLEVQLQIKLQQAKLFEIKEESNSALSIYVDVSNEAKKNGYNAIYYESSLLIAKFYYKLENYDIANIGLSIAYINAVDHKNLQFQKDALFIQAKCYSKQEDYKNAYAVMTQLFGVINQIKEKQQREIIKELEIQYETLQKEQAISDLKEEQIIQEAELSRQKTIKIAFLIGFLIILVPIIALLYTYYQKIQTQSELAKKNEEINQQKVSALKQEQELKLIKAAIEGQDEERKRIAQELHDSIGGNLAGIKLQLASVKKRTETLDIISGQLDETYQLVRDISHTLIPQKFRQNDFAQLITEYIKSISNTGKISVNFHPHPIEKINSINEIVKMELFKIIQELMTNTLKHSQASKADIHLNYFEDSISLIFEDNGVGFNSKEKKTGIGFNNIENRVKKLNGTVHIDSMVNRGTVISIDIPIKNITNEI